jgi:hypothetical protein
MFIFVKEYFMKKISLLLLMSLFLINCGVVQRQALMRDKYPLYPDNIKKAIDNRYIIKGMNQTQVYLALGTTLCISSSYYKNKQIIVWAYSPDPITGKPMSGTFDCYRARQRVYFENREVVGWDNMSY